MKNIAIVIISIVLFTQCTEKEDAKPKFDLIGTTWILKSGSGEASFTGDLNGDGINDDESFPYDDFVMYEVGSEVKFENATTILLSNEDYDVYEEISYTIAGDEIKLESDWGEFYFLLKVNGDDMTLAWDKATFKKTFGSGIEVLSSNIRYELVKR